MFLRADRRNSNEAESIQEKIAKKYINDAKNKKSLQHVQERKSSKAIMFCCPCSLRYQDMLIHLLPRWQDIHPIMLYGGSILLGGKRRIDNLNSFESHREVALWHLDYAVKSNRDSRHIVLIPHWPCMLALECGMEVRDVVDDTMRVADDLRKRYPSHTIVLEIHFDYGIVSQRTFNPYWLRSVTHFLAAAFHRTTPYRKDNKRYRGRTYEVIPLHQRGLR